MTTDEAFYRRWQEVATFTFSDAPADRSCRYAVAFGQWCGDLCQRVTANLTLVTVQEAKVRLLDRWYDLRSVVPKAHRHRLDNIGHRCIGTVFVEAYEALRVAELTLPASFHFTEPAALLPPAQPKREEDGFYLYDEE